MIVKEVVHTTSYLVVCCTNAPQKYRVWVLQPANRCNNPLPGNVSIVLETFLAWCLRRIRGGLECCWCQRVGGIGALLCPPVQQQTVGAHAGERGAGGGGGAYSAWASWTADFCSSGDFKKEGVGLDEAIAASKSSIVQTPAQRGMGGGGAWYHW